MVYCGIVYTLFSLFLICLPYLLLGAKSRALAMTKFLHDQCVSVLFSLLFTLFWLPWPLNYSEHIWNASASYLWPWGFFLPWLFLRYPMTCSPRVLFLKISFSLTNPHIPLTMFSFKILTCFTTMTYFYLSSVCLLKCKQHEGEHFVLVSA